MKLTYTIFLSLFLSYTQVLAEQSPAEEPPSAAEPASKAATQRADDRFMKLTVFPLLSYYSVDFRAGKNFSAGLFTGSASASAASGSTSETINITTTGVLISYWPKLAISDDYAFNFFIGSTAVKDTYCNPSCAVTQSNGSYWGVFWQRYWLWPNGFNLSAGIGFESISQISTVNIATISLSKLTVPLGVGWAF